MDMKRGKLKYLGHVIRGQGCVQLFRAAIVAITRMRITVMVSNFRLNMELEEEN